MTESKPAGWSGQQERTAQSYITQYLWDQGLPVRNR